MLVNFWSRRETLKISDQATETWPRIWAKYRADKAAAHCSTGNPHPPSDVGAAAASIEFEGDRVIERVLTKHCQRDRAGRNGWNSGPDALAQLSAPFHDRANR